MSETVESFFENGKITQFGVRQVRIMAEDGLNTQEILERISEPLPEKASFVIRAFIAVARRDTTKTQKHNSQFIENDALNNAGKQKLRELAQIRPKLSAKEIAQKMGILDKISLQSLTASLAIARRQ